MPDAAVSNRDRMKEIVAGIEDGIQKLFQSERYAEYLSTMSRFHSYSVNNTVLIHMQMPDASVVAGFHKWKNQFGRHVKKGETGITIIAPTPFKKRIEKEKVDPDTNLPVLDADGNPIIEEKIVEIPMFKPVKVFDVSQTEGKPLPHLSADLTGNVQHFEAFMEALRRTSPVPLEIQPLRESLDGYFSNSEQKIVVRSGMSEVQTVCAAVHEMGHALLHNRERAQAEAAAGTNGAGPKPKDKNTKEVEAESVSYAVCQYYGIETGENSFGYIATWSKDRSLPELRDSLETITKTANTLISGIDKNFAEVCKERGISLLDQQERVVDAADRAGEPDISDTPERFAADFCEYLEKLYQAGIVSSPFTTGTKDEVAARLAAEVLRRGQFTGTREELTRICKLTNAPTAAALLERLEKLSDAWDAALTCSQHSYPYDDGTGPRSYITAYQKDDPKRKKEVIFVGSKALCDKLMAELRDGAVTIRQIRDRNARQSELQDRMAALIYDAMTDEETLFQVNGAYYLHIQSDPCTGFDYSLYDAETLRLMDGGQFSAEGLGAYGKADPMEAACWAVCFRHSIIPEKIEPQPMDMLETIQEANTAPEPPASHTAELIEHFSQEDAFLLDTTLDEYPMPDETVDDDALVNAGYVGDDLLPVGENLACELIEQDTTVYLLHPGDEPEMVFDGDEIREQSIDTVFAIPRQEWEQSASFRDAVAGRMDRQEQREAAFLDHAADCFAIYQIKLDDDERRHGLRYERFERLKEPPKKSDYELAYTAPLPEGATLETLFEQFNLHHPADYQRPSMSVSDIVAVKREGVLSYHYCDSMGFVELPDFTQPESQLKNAELGIDASVGSNGPKQPTVAELEGQVKAGQTISLTDLANAIHAEQRSKTTAKRASVLGKLNGPLPSQNKKKAPKRSAERDR